MAADVFGAVSDPTRRRLLDLLREEPAPVHALAESFDMSRPAVSQHLKVLKDAGLVSDVQVGRLRLYRLNAEPLREIDAWMDHYRKFWPARLMKLGRYLKKKHGA